MTEDLGIFFNADEFATSIDVDGETVTAIVDDVQQKRHEVSGLMVETLRISAGTVELGQVTVGQLRIINGVEWEVESVDGGTAVVVVNLVRNLG